MRTARRFMAPTLPEAARGGRGNAGPRSMIREPARAWLRVGNRDAIVKAWRGFCQSTARAMEREIIRFGDIDAILVREPRAHRLLLAGAPPSAASPGLASTSFTLTGGFAWLQCWASGGSTDSP